MTVDPKAPPCTYMVSILLGEYDILEVFIPPLDLPALSLPLGLLEEMSEMLDPLLDLAHAILPALIPGSTPPISTLTSFKACSGSLIAPSLIPLSSAPMAIVQIPVPTAVLFMPLLQINVLEKVGIPTDQTALMFGSALPTATPEVVAI